MYSEISRINYTVAQNLIYSRYPIIITSLHLASPLCNCLNDFFSCRSTILNREKGWSSVFIYNTLLLSLTLTQDTSSWPPPGVITMFVHNLGTNVSRGSKTKQETGGSVDFAWPPSDDLVPPRGSFYFVRSTSIY